MGAVNQLSPEQIAEIAARVITAERMNFGKSSDGDGGRAQRNRDWARIAGIIHHGHQVYNPIADPRWHIKDAGGGRPQSDDVLAFKDTRMIIDFIGGAGADGFSVRAGHWEGPIGPEQNIYAPPVPEGGGVVTPVPPTPSEVWTTAHQATWDALKAKGLLSPIVVAQQLNHRFPGQVWGQKRAGAGRGISDNTIAMKLPNGRLYGVKISPFVHLWGPLETAQIMEGEGAGAVNHLGDTSPVDPPVDPPAPTPPVTPTPPAPTLDLKPLLDKLEAVIVLSTEARDNAKAAQDAVDTASKKKLRVQAKADLRGNITGTIESE